MDAAVLVVLIVAGVGGLAIACAIVFRRKREADRIEALRRSLPTEATERMHDLARYLSPEASSGAVRAAGLISLGCAYVDDGWPERAARPFQVAYHLESGYCSAMVLAFACMKVNHASRAELLRTFLETWDETGFPELGASWPERALMAGGSNGTLHPPAGASSLARSLWSLPSKELRRQIAQALEERQAWARPLWNGSAAGVDISEVGATASRPQTVEAARTSSRR